MSRKLSKSAVFAYPFRGWVERDGGRSEDRPPNGIAWKVSLPAVSEHLKVLEHAGLIMRGRSAQWRPCQLHARPRVGLEGLDRREAFGATVAAKGFTNPVCEVNVRPGSATLIHMRAPDGRVYAKKGKFEEIVAPERLVFLSGAMDEAGNLLFEIRNTVTFAEAAGETSVSLRAHVVSATAAAPAYKTGWTQSLEPLEAFVAKG